MARRQREFIVGLFSLIGLVGLVFLTVQIKGTSLFEGSYKIEVRFPEVAGTLVRGASVLVYGVKVGDVLDIRIDPTPEYPEEPVVIELGIRESMKLYEDATVEIVESTIIGETTVVITPGSPASPPVTDGMTVHGHEPADIFGDIAQQAPEIVMEIGQSVQTVNDFLRNLNEQGQITRSINDLAAVIHYVRAAVVDEQGDVHAVTANIRRFTEHLDESLTLFDETMLEASAEMHAMRTAVTDSVATLSSDSQAGIGQAREALASLQHTLATVDEYTEQNRARWESITQSIEETAARLNSLMQGLDEGRGTAGRLLTDERLYSEVTDLLASLNQWLGRLDSILSGTREPLGERVVPYEQTPRSPSAP